MAKAQTPQTTTVTVTLDTPIQRGESTIEEVTLRKPTSGELRGVSLADVLQMQVDAVLTVAPRLTTPALNAAELRNMDPADFVQLAGEIAGFLLSKQARMEA